MHSEHQLTLQERESGSVWMLGYDPCSFETMYSIWHPFELGMLPQASIGNETAIAVQNGTVIECNYSRNVFIQNMLIKELDNAALFLENDTVSDVAVSAKNVVIVT